MLPWTKLEIKKQWRNIPKDYTNLEVIGYDTETYHGKVVLLASPDDYIYPRDCFDVFNFLTTKKRRGSIGFFLTLPMTYKVSLNSYL